MNKKILISLIATSLLTNSLMAEDKNNRLPLETNKTVFINAETVVGDKILSDEKAYVQYLKNKAIATAIQDKRNLQVKKNCKDIAKLKKAVAKLIQDNRRHYSITNSLNTNMNSSSTELVIIEAPLESKTEKISPFKETVKIERPKPKINCTTSYVRKFDTKAIRGSYFALSPNKKFTVVRSNTHSYKYPVLNIDKEDSYKIGSTFIGDMYTRAGWVHVKNGGWVKGYKVNPPIKYYKSNSKERSRSAFTEKKIINCKEEK